MGRGSLVFLFILFCISCVFNAIYKSRIVDLEEKVKYIEKFYSNQLELRDEISKLQQGNGQR